MILLKSRLTHTRNLKMTDKLSIKDCEKAIAALSTSQMKNSLMARSLMDIHQQLADMLRENERLNKALEIADGKIKGLLNEYELVNALESIAKSTNDLFAMQCAWNALNSNKDSGNG